MTNQNEKPTAGYSGSFQETAAKRVSDYLIEGLRHQVKSLVDYLESEPITSHGLDYQLSSVDMGVVLALTDLVDLLPFSVQEEVKRLLALRERIWYERYPLAERNAQEKESQL